MHRPIMLEFGMLLVYYGCRD